MLAVAGSWLAIKRTETIENAIGQVRVADGDRAIAEVGVGLKRKIAASGNCRHG